MGGVSSELLARVASAGPDPLLLRLVCRQWASSLAQHVTSAKLLHPGSEPDILGLSPSLADLRRLSAFRNLSDLDLSGLEGTKECLESVASLTSLNSLTLGQVAEEHASSLTALTALTALSSLQLSPTTRSCFAHTLTGLIAALPQLVCLRLECLDDSAEHCASLDLPAVLHSDALSQLEISGNVGVSEANLRSLSGLELRQLRIQVSDAAAYRSLTVLTSLKALTVADWAPGPSSAAAAQQLSLEQFSSLTGLTRLAVVHTFGNFQVIQLEGLSSLRHLRELALHLPSTLEDLDELAELRHLGARVQLKLPFDPDLDIWLLDHLTSLCFQEMLPVVEDGVEMPDRNQELCLGRVVHLTSLQQLVIQRGASAIWGPSLPTLHQLAGLTQLHLMGEGEPWQADEYPVWQSALAALTGLKDLVVDGCTNLQRLELGRLSRLTHLGLAGCPQLQVDGVAALTALQGLALTNSGPLASQFLQHADALTGLRYFDAFGSVLTDACVSELLRLTSLRSLDVRGSHITLLGALQLRQLPYLTRLEYNVAA